MGNMSGPAHSGTLQRCCGSCGFQQESRYSYCGHCGQSMLSQCWHCQQFLPPFFRHCGYCGVALQQHGAGVPAVHPAPIAYAASQVSIPPQYAAQPQTAEQPAPASAVPESSPAVALTPAVLPAQPPAAAVASPAQVVPGTAAIPDTPRSISEPAAPMAQSAVARVSERRLVAILFCDVCGFTAMSEKLDPEEVSDIIQPLFQECNAAIAKFGGIVEKFIGDAIMALFGVPMAHEDDPERAALAALEMRSIIQRFGADLEKRMGFSINMRIGLNVGTVVAGTISALEGGGGKNHQVLGDSINTAARMEQNAVPGNILVTEEMYHLIKDSFELKPDKLIQAKGKKEPLQAYDLVGVRQLRQRSRGLAERNSTLVGRQALLDDLSTQGQSALRERQPLSLLLQGDSGLGKTRLAMEVYNQLLTEAPNLRLLQGTATSYSRGFAYFTLQNLVRSLLEVDETVPHAEVHQRIQDLMQHEQIANASLNSNLLEYLLYPHLEMPQLKLMSPDRLQQQIFRAVTDILLQLGKRQPLLLLMDDLQWCDPLTLQWLQGFQQGLSQQRLPLMLLGTSRLDSSEELAELSWQQQQQLEPLSNEQALILLNCLLERGETTELPMSLQPLGEAILERAAGNPYYLEEVLKNLLDDELLVCNDEGQWKLTCLLRDLPLPNSVQRLIMSRFDRLPDTQRQLLQTLSAVGPSASWELIQQIVESPQLENELQALTHSGFVRLHTCLHGKEYLFNQALAQEVIYNTMVNRRKSAIHQQIGEKLEQMHMSDPSQVLELLAFHFARTPEVPKAVRYLNLSAEQAARLYANDQAREQYGQILDLLNKLEPDALIGVDLHNRQWLKAARLYNHVVQKQCELLLLSGAYDDVLNQVEAAFERELTPLEQARFLYCKGRVLEKRSKFAEARSEFEAAQQLLDSADPKEQARILNAMGWVSRWMSEYDAALDFCQQALALLEEHPDMEQIAYAHNVMGVVYFYQHNWEESLRHYQQSLEIQQRIQDIWGHANSLSNIGNVYFMTNRWKEAIEAFENSLSLREQLGDLEGIATSCNNLGHAFQELGEYPKAEGYIHKALNNYREMGHGIGEAVARCNLGTVAFRQGQRENALSHLNAGIELLEARKMEAMLAEVYNHRLQLYLEADALSTAADCLAQNGPTIESHGDPLQKGRLARLQGWLALKQGELDSAEAHLQTALDSLQTGDHRQECRWLYQHLAQLHQAKNSDQASYWERQAESLSEVPAA